MLHRQGDRGRYLARQWALPKMENGRCRLGRLSKLWLAETKPESPALKALLQLEAHGEKARVLSDAFEQSHHRSVAVPWPD